MLSNQMQEYLRRAGIFEDSSGPEGLNEGKQSAKQASAEQASLIWDLLRGTQHRLKKLLEQLAQEYAAGPEPTARDRAQGQAVRADKALEEAVLAMKEVVDILK